VRYVIYGAGAVGGTIAARLHLAGRQVAVIARGDHLAAMQRAGLRFVTPDDDSLVGLPAFASAADAELDDGDVVVLCVKTQDTSAALDALAAAAPPGTAIVCAQNGIDSERQAMRRLRNVYGMLVYLPAQHLAPGIVQAFSSPVHGVLDIGRLPHATDEFCTEVANDLEAAGFASRPVDDVMAWKRAKLLRNLGNAFDALLGEDVDVEDLERRAIDEARECFAACGLDAVADDQAEARMAAMSPPRPAGEQPRGGSSSWQSVARGTGSIETDWLNGEIVLLGRLNGIPTPVNEAVQLLAGRLAREHGEPGSVGRADIEALLEGPCAPDHP